MLTLSVVLYTSFGGGSALATATVAYSESHERRRLLREEGRIPVSAAAATRDSLFFLSLLFFVAESIT